MAALGSRLLSGDEKIRDEKKGREWLKKAIAAKEYTAYLALGDYEENVKKDLKAALAEYERGKDAGQIDCMLRTADFYIEGKGVEKDADPRPRAAAKKPPKPAARSPISASPCKRSPAKSPNLLLAATSYLLAAANGNLAEAQNELGLLYLSGKLGIADSPAGVAWLTRAAQGGYAQAQNNLATLYERGAAGRHPRTSKTPANSTRSPPTKATARPPSPSPASSTKASAPRRIRSKAWALATLAQERGEEDRQETRRRNRRQTRRHPKAEAKKELEDIKSGKNAEPKPAATPAPQRNPPPPRLRPKKPK